MSVRVYVEGGGQAKEQQIRCREGFRKLVESAGLGGRMPRFVACGARNEAYDSFRTAFANEGDDDYALLLVDSEEPLGPADASVDSAFPWAHLQRRDGWEQPAGAADD